MTLFEHGTPVTSLLPSALQRLTSGAWCELAEFEVAGRMQRRVASVAVKELVSVALERRMSTHAPFWNEVLDMLHRQAGASADTLDIAAARLEVLKLAGYHLDLSTAATSHSFQGDEEGTRRAVARTTAGLRAGRILALRSRCISADAGWERHLQMLDFRLPVEPASQRVIEATLRTMGLQGWLLSSGRSYHFLGAQVMSSPQSLMAFLGRAMLYAPIVDGRWVAHQMIEGQCALRISSGNADQIVPILIAQV